MKSVRFTELVKSAGKPETYTLWLDPKNDGTFQRALKQHRVLSVHQETVGTKADYGNVGYEGDKRAQILIFPKSIEQFADRRVVGVKYDLLEQPRAREPRPRQLRPREGEAPAKPSAATKATRSTAKPTAPKKKERKEKEKEKKHKAEPKPAPPASAPNLKILPFKKAEETAEPEPQELNRDELVKGIRAAMKLLNEGKAVAAYRILEGLV